MDANKTKTNVLIREKFEIEITDEMVEDFLNSLEENKKREDATLTKEYLDWLANFLVSSETHTLADDDFLYREESEDRKKSMELSYLFGALMRRNILVSEEEDEFSSCTAYFSYNGNTYKIETIFGQGSVTTIELCTNGEQKDVFDIEQYIKDVA